VIVAFFDTGISNGNSPVNYLLGDKDYKGNKRSVKPEVVRGEPNSTIEIINSIDRKLKYTSGVISFRDNEKPSSKQMDDIMVMFEMTMLAGLTEQNFNILWVLHQDKGNTELHFLVPRQELTTAKSMNMMPPGKKSQELVKNFQKILNNKYGWEQVVADPLKVQLSGFDAKVLPKLETKISKPNVIKKSLSQGLQKNILSGAIKNRDDLIKSLKKNGVLITREGNDYISAKLPGHEKARRFKDGIFHKDADYTKIVDELYSMKARVKLSGQELEEAKTALNNTVRERAKFNTKQYLTKRVFKAYGTRRIKNQPLVKQPIIKSETPSQIDLDKSHTSNNQNLGKGNTYSQSKEFKDRVDDNEAISPSGGANNSLALNIQIQTLIGTINNLEQKIGREMNPIKRGRLYAQINELKAKMAGLLAQLNAEKPKIRGKPS